jgi:hypothetical protein
MNFDRAKRTLARLLNANPKALDRFTENTGDPITSHQLAADMVEWLNVAEPDDTDVMRLLSLAKSGRFRSWDCPMCGEIGTRVYVGEPADWGHFQGVCQADYSSYPGYGIGSDDRRCDSCRMSRFGEAQYLPEGSHLEYD